MNDHSLLKTYVETLVENDYKRGKLVKCFGSESTIMSSTPEIDLVLDGGAFNGGYTLGALLYIKYAEKRGYLHVRRISGCSVGACVGLAYALDKLDEMTRVLTKFMEMFRQNSNMSFYKQFVTEFLDILLEENGLSKCQNNLFISCFNKNEDKQIVVNTYENKEELRLAILRTIYIPFLSNDNITDSDGYIDGGYPHIFSDSEEIDGRKQLYIQLNGIDKFFNMIHIKSESTIVNRMMRGLEDIRSFVQRGGEQTFMCSFVENWNPIDNVLYKSKPFLCTTILYLFHQLENGYNRLPENVRSQISTFYSLHSSKTLVDIIFKFMKQILEQSIKNIV
jgi:transcriptional regulator CtsR